MEKNKSVGRIVSCIHRFTAINLHKKLEKYNIGPGQLHFLMVLYHNEGINQECLSHKLMIDKATSARAIKKLEEEGYITRKVDENDKRAYKISLTEKAYNFKPIVRQILHEWRDILLIDFNEKEKKTLLDLLEKLSKNAKKGIEKSE